MGALPLEDVFLQVSNSLQTFPLSEDAWTATKLEALDLILVHKISNIAANSFPPLIPVEESQIPKVETKPLAVIHELPQCHVLLTPIEAEDVKQEADVLSEEVPLDVEAHSRAHCGLDQTRIKT